MPAYQYRHVTIPAPDGCPPDDVDKLADAITDLLRGAGRRKVRCVASVDSLSFPIAATSEWEAVAYGQAIVDAQWAIDSDPELNQPDDRRVPLI